MSPPPSFIALQHGNVPTVCDIGFHFISDHNLVEFRALIAKCNFAIMETIP